MSNNANVFDMRVTSMKRGSFSAFVAGTMGGNNSLGRRRGTRDLSPYACAT